MACRGHGGAYNAAVPSDLSDADVASRAAAGDSQAEAEMCRRMAPRLRLYGMRHLRSGAAADDLVQQVLLTTLEALRAGKLRDYEKLPHFVLGMARMTVLELRRGAKRRGALLEIYGAILVPEAPIEPEVDRERLGRCLQSLKERDRSVVMLTFYDDRAGSDVARFLGVSEANVRVIRHRAIRQLRGCMEGEVA
ncbi:RNA polymerase sigma factor [Luteitalea pratensis]|uniref:RNA polymerase sigma factor n=1 Tax=Luteitalea pratensis TaxID=1855912 RepID=A0A143PJA4_LUTPR|nr:RNA polymerase sigma factor [Luteitalea pratensis]